MSDPTGGPLKGVRVLDLSRVLAGPWATQLLGDLGADVIKVERPDGGDDTRGWGPPFLPGEDGQHGDAAYYLSANRNKRSICIDLTTPEGAELVREIAKSSHILMENFKVGGLKKYGLDYDSVSKIAPHIVYCSITGFGQTGPFAPRAGYDYIVQAMSGLMSVTGQPDGAPGAEPMKAGIAVADLFTGLFSVAGALAALRHAEATGEGQHVDLALLDCQIAALTNQATNYLIGGTAPTRMGNAHPNIVPYQVFRTSDGHVVLACGADRQFRHFCEAIDQPALAEDPRFAKNEDRVRHRADLIPLLEAEFVGRSTDDWIALLENAGVPGGPINTMDRVFSQEQVVARGLAKETGRAGTLIGCPVNLSRTPAVDPKEPPRLDENGDEILSDVLGFSEEKIASLRRNGVVGANR